MKNMAGKMIFGLITFGLISLLSSCEESEDSKECRKNPATFWSKYHAQEIKSSLVYFKDERTGLCFAVGWAGAANGGPAFTLVPENKVKDFLIK